VSLPAVRPTNQARISPSTCLSLQVPVESHESTILVDQFSERLATEDKVILKIFRNADFWKVTKTRAS
jgi:hypothetical protein